MRAILFFLDCGQRRLCVRFSKAAMTRQMEGHACRAHRNAMDNPTLRCGRDKRIPPKRNGPDKRVRSEADVTSGGLLGSIDG